MAAPGTGGGVMLLIKGPGSLGEVATYVFYRLVLCDRPRVDFADAPFSAVFNGGARPIAIEALGLALVEGYVGDLRVDASTIVGGPTRPFSNEGELLIPATLHH
jgi:hypothetical protein